MSRFRTFLSSLSSLTASVALSVCSILVTSSHDAEATPTVSARLVSIENIHGETVHVTLRTQEGLERFVFTPRESATTNTAEVHFSGFARPRNFQKEKLPAALTIAEGRAWIFFTSRRTGRPAAAIVTLTRAEDTLITKRTRISRVPEKTLECGSHASDHAKLTSAPATSRKRRVNRSSHSKLYSSITKPFSPARVLEVATEADYEFFQVYGSNTNAYIRAVLNAVDALYTDHLGVKIKVVGQRVATNYPGSRGSLDSVDLLEEFRRGSFASSSSADVRHLFTGRSTKGLTIGIAYVAAACTAGGRYAVGLSRNVSPGLQPFLAAHEIAHNLSATHDGERNSIMNPAITEENTRFSPQSLTTIRDFLITTGSCITSNNLSSARIALDGTDPTQFLARVSFNATGAASCSVTLYGSGDARRYIPLATQTIARGSNNSSRTAAFAAKAPTLQTSQTFYFKAKVSCENSRMISAPAKLRYGLATSGTGDARGSSRWLETLRNNLR
jgi:hypothetical protein